MALHSDALQVLSNAYPVRQRLVDNLYSVERYLNALDPGALFTEMPGLDVLSFMTMLRELALNVPVIVLTEHGSVDGYIHAISLGAFEYLNKPVRACELIRIVSVALEGLPGPDDEYMRERQSPFETMFSSGRERVGNSGGLPCIKSNAHGAQC